MKYRKVERIAESTNSNAVEKLLMVEIKELEAIKGLLTVLLLKLGASSEEIGDATQVDSSYVRQRFQIRKFKKIIP